MLGTSFYDAIREFLISLVSLDCFSLNYHFGSHSQTRHHWLRQQETE
jgi:hypothetical protein